MDSYWQFSIKQQIFICKQQQVLLGKMLVLSLFLFLPPFVAFCLYPTVEHAYSVGFMFLPLLFFVVKLLYVVRSVVLLQKKVKSNESLVVEFSNEMLN